MIGQVMLKLKGDLYLYALVISDFLNFDGFIIACLKIMG